MGSLILNRKFIEELSYISKYASLSFKPNQNLVSFRNKALMLGLRVYDISNYLIIYQIKTDSITVVSDGSILLGEPVFKNIKHSYIATYSSSDTHIYEIPINTGMNLDGKVVDYPSIQTTGIFSETLFKSIDLTGVDCSKTRYLTDLFKGCKATEIILDNICTESMTDMSGAFSNIKLNRLDLSSLNCERLDTAYELLSNSSIDELNLGNTGIGDRFGKFN